MVRFIQSVRHFITDAAYDTRSFFSVTVARLAWGIGVFAVLLSTAAYVWWRQEPVAASVTTSSQNTTDTIPESVQPSIEKIDAAIPNDTDTASGSDDASYSQPADNTVNTEVYVNGQEIPMPPEGTVHKEISNQNGKTSVDISVESSTSGASHSHSSTKIDMKSRTTTESVDMD